MLIIRPDFGKRKINKFYAKNSRSCWTELGTWQGIRRWFAQLKINWWLSFAIRIHEDYCIIWYWSYQRIWSSDDINFLPHENSVVQTVKFVTHYWVLGQNESENRTTSKTEKYRKTAGDIDNHDKTQASVWSIFHQLSLSVFNSCAVILIHVTEDYY